MTGFGESAGAPLVQHPDVNKIAFTGSAAVGKQIVDLQSLDLDRTKAGILLLLIALRGRSGTPREDEDEY